MYFALIDKEIDTETITKEEIKKAFEDFQPFQHVHCYFKNNLCEVIENSSIEEEEKLKLYLYMSRKLKGINLLNRSLFNILLLLKENTNELPSDLKLASLKSLSEKYLIFSYDKKYTIKLNKNISFDLKKNFYKITSLGRKYLSSMEQQGKEYIEKQKNIFKELGL